MFLYTHIDIIPLVCSQRSLLCVLHSIQWRPRLLTSQPRIHVLHYYASAYYSYTHPNAENVLYIKQMGFILSFFLFRSEKKTTTTQKNSRIATTTWISQRWLDKCAKSGYRVKFTLERCFLPISSAHTGGSFVFPYSLFFFVFDTLLL